MKKKKTTWRECKMIGRFLAWTIMNDYKSEEGKMWSKNGVFYTTGELFDIYENSVLAVRREKTGIRVCILCIMFNFLILLISPNGLASILNIFAMVFNAYLIDKIIQRRRKRRKTMSK